MLGSSIGSNLQLQTKERRCTGDGTISSWQASQKVHGTAMTKLIHHRSVDPTSGNHRVYDLLLYRTLAYNREEDQEGASCNSAAEARMEEWE